MTPAQQKYLRERLSTIASARISKLPSKGLTKEDKEKLFAKGVFTVEESYGNYSVVFPEDKEKRESYEAAYSLIMKEKVQLLDHIMLSGLGEQGGVDITAALEAFANK